MDNFEYSIQINDRDWAEFYSTAEECGLMQVTLATEEELLLSEPEHEDGLSKPKFIRVSLCPPKEEPPTVPSAPAAVFQAERLTYKIPIEDVLSGSEDEEDLGSVTRFLCQRETLLYKQKKEKNIDASVDIPVPNQADIDCKKFPGTEIPQQNENLVDQMRALDRLLNQQYDGEAKLNPVKNTLQDYSLHRIGDEEEEIGTTHDVLSGTNMRSFLEHTSFDGAETGNHMSPSVHGSGSTLPELRPDRAIQQHVILSCPMSSPIASEQTKDKTFNGFSCEVKKQKVTTSSGKENQEELGHLDLTKNVDEPQINSPEIIQDFRGVSKSQHNDSCNDDIGHKGHLMLAGLEMDGGLHVASRAMEHSSAVQQNIPDTLTGILGIGNPQSGNVKPAKAYRGYAPTDEFGSVFQMACTASSPMLTCSHIPVSIPEKTLHSSDPCINLNLTPYKDTGLTTPEMYEFFDDDISETTNMDTKPQAHCSREDGIMYTPDMYEYFFLGSDEEEGSEMKGKQEQKPSAASLFSSAENPENISTPESFCLPEAYEFFFVDGPDDQKGGEDFTLSAPASHAQSAAVASLQTLVPQGGCRVRKGFTVRRSHHRAVGVGQELNTRHRTEDTTVAVTGKGLHRIPAGTGDACLVLLAFTSWAVTSSDLRSSDGWKTALLANVGAISAIRYLRRNTSAQGP
ncbi:PGC-1 and ERR-induced regulator in muscle protein 1 [Pelodytes ibericus]